MPEVVFVQDHLVQRGGAERVLLSMLKAAPAAPVHVAFYRPEQCYPEFAEVDIRPFPLDRIGPLSRRHRLAMPLLAPAFSAHRVEADVVFCCTSGWSQGVRTNGRKVLYFHALPRWLYERDAYLGSRGALARAGVAALAPLLERWDRRTVASGQRFLTQGTVMRDRLREIYGIDAEIVPVPMALDIHGAQRPVDGIEPGFFLCPSRLMPYKNIDIVLEAFARLPDQRLVVAGDGPEEVRLRALAPRNATLHGLAQDDELRWLYANCRAVVTAAFEPFGVTPIEGAAFGKPTVAPRAGGFVDTVIDGRTGVHFERPEPDGLAAGMRRLLSLDLDENVLKAHAGRYAESSFVATIRRVIDEELARG